MLIKFGRSAGRSHRLFWTILLNYWMFFFSLPIFRFFWFFFFCFRLLLFKSFASVRALSICRWLFILFTWIFCCNSKWLRTNECIMQKILSDNVVIASVNAWRSIFFMCLVFVFSFRGHTKSDTYIYVQSEKRDERARS